MSPESHSLQPRWIPLHVVNIGGDLQVFRRGGHQISCLNDLNSYTTLLKHGGFELLSWLNKLLCRYV